jgi:hypothetical protein
MTTDTLTIQQSDGDEQRIDISTSKYDPLIHIDVTDEDDSCIVLQLSTTEAERLIAALSVQVAMARLAAA